MVGVQKGKKLDYVIFEWPFRQIEAYFTWSKN